MNKKDSISSIFEDALSTNRGFYKNKKVILLVFFVLLLVLGMVTKYFVIPNLGTSIFNFAVLKPSEVEVDADDSPTETMQNPSQGSLQENDIKDRVKIIEGSIDSLNTVPNNEELFLDIPEIGM